MKAKTIIFSLIFSLVSTNSFANAGFMEIIQNGKLKCGIDMSGKTYGYKDDDGYLRGMGIDICKAYATAIFGSENAFEVVDSNDLSFERDLATKKIDLMIGANEISAIKSQSSIAEKIDIMAYDTQGLLVRKKENAKSISDYKGERVCISTNFIELYNLNKASDDENLDFNNISFQTRERTREAFLLKRCNLISSNRTYLISVLQNNLENSPEYEILKEDIAIRPIYIYANKKNQKMITSSKWIFNALKNASDLDINSNNIDITLASKDAVVQNLLGDNVDLWTKLDVNPTWLRKTIKSLGNYDEIYKRNLGEDSIFKLDIDINKTKSNGGDLDFVPFI